MPPYNGIIVYPLNVMVIVNRDQVTGRDIFLDIAILFLSKTKMIHNQALKYDFQSPCPCDTLALHCRLFTDSSSYTSILYRNTTWTKTKGIPLDRCAKCVLRGTNRRHSAPDAGIWSKVLDACYWNDDWYISLMPHDSV